MANSNPIVPADIQTPMTDAELAAFGLPYADLLDYSALFVAQNIDTYWTRRPFQRAILALIGKICVPVWNASGGSIPAGPMSVLGIHTGLGYLVNGGFSEGATLVGVDTGTDPIAVGSIINFAGINGNFISATALTGAGSISFLPALPSDVADNTVLTIDRGYRVAPAGAFEAQLLTMTAIANNSRGQGVLSGSFDTAALDTSLANIDDPVYVTSAGVMTLIRPTDGSTREQVVAYVETLANPGRVNGFITSPRKIGQAQIVDGGILGSNVGASTTQAFVPPRMTTVQRTALTAVAGMVVYDSDLHALCTYNGTDWKFVLAGIGALNGAGSLDISASVPGTPKAIVATYGLGTSGAGILNLQSGPYRIISASGATDSGKNVQWVASY